jgi:DNA-binding response OmpR family regulator
MRVLVIEDEPELACALTQALRESGLAADAAMDGEEGLQLGLDGAVDLVILDLLLPKRPGLSVLKELRRVRPELPILCLTALDMVEEKIDGLDRGADDYVTKPFALAELLARVRALLRRGHRVIPASRFRISDLEIDFASRMVTRGGAAISLSPREYALLLHFVANQGRALTRTEIGEHVIDAGFAPASNVIDVSVHGLRAKLGEPSVVHTVRGVGYRFAAPLPVP